MSGFRFLILEDRQKSLETTIDFLLNCGEYSWDKIYLFSAFVNDYGVKQIEKILVHPYLNENTEVLIAIGQKNNFNDPSDIQNLLKFIDEESTKIKTKSVRFICPTNNFHIKTYCFLGRRVKDDKKEIGFSIIGSSNLTQRGLECEGELCISIQRLNLTKKLIYRLSTKYSNSPQWSPEIIRKYQIEYDKKYPGKDQNEVLPILNRQDGKFIELGVLTDSVLRAQATNLVNGREKISCFYSYAPTTIEQAKENFPELSLCLLFSTENEIFRIVEIMSHCPNEENTEGCFVTYRVNVTYESDDICEILEKEEYKEIKIAEEKYEEYRERNEYPKLEYATLNKFENEVMKMLNDQNYKKGLEKGKKKMQKMQLEEIEELLKINDIDLIKKKLEELKESYSM